MSDLDAAVAWAGQSSSGDASRVGVTGFCWGGRITWLYAAHNPKLKAGVAWYGRLAGEATELQPKYPLDVAAALHAPVLGLYGGQDQGIPLEDVEKMRAALAAAKQPSQIVVFPDAPHGFHADYRPSFRADGREGCLGPVPRLVPQERRRLIPPEHADRRYQRQPVPVFALEFESAVAGRSRTRNRCSTDCAGRTRW